MVGGFSLHAGVAAEAHESHKLEKLCRYITRPAISEKRLSISPQGRVRYQLKTPWKKRHHPCRMGSRGLHRQAGGALVPPPRAHLTRFHGVFAPNAESARAADAVGAWHAACARCRSRLRPAPSDAPRSPEEKRRGMTWAQSSATLAST
jgi:hypothetical protein